MLLQKPPPFSLMAYQTTTTPSSPESIHRFSRGFCHQYVTAFRGRASAETGRCAQTEIFPSRLFYAL